MSTSDQQGNVPLTRKQLREIRLTGTTPVISEEEAAAAAAEAKPVPAVPEPVAAVPVEAAPAPTADSDASPADAPLTRRQVREQERIRTASVPVVAPEEPEAATDEGLVSGVPVFADEREDEVVDVAPVSAMAPAEDADLDEHDGDPLSALDVDDADDDDDDETPDEREESEPLPTAEPVATGENLVVSPTFGNGLLAEKGDGGDSDEDKSDVPSFTPSFDDLITADSNGSQHLAPNTLIFNPSPGEGSLSGPVASTGEILVTGSYELPQGIGSQGHAHGTADGKEADAVLIDGELPATSSPTPIAASSAISTIKPAGEVIRPPAPEKGNKLMLTLAITAGGLALALAVALVVAFTMNIFS